MLFVEENKRVRSLSLLCVKMILASLSSKYKEWFKKSFVPQVFWTPAVLQAQFWVLVRELWAKQGLWSSWLSVILGREYKEILFVGYFLIYRVLQGTSFPLADSNISVG